MKIGSVEVRKIGTQLVVGKHLLSEDHDILWFKHYGLTKITNAFFLIVAPDEQSIIWYGLEVETKVAVALKKEFRAATPESTRGPQLWRVINFAFDNGLW